MGVIILPIPELRRLCGVWGEMDREPKTPELSKWKGFETLAVPHPHFTNTGAKVSKRPLISVTHPTYGKALC